MSCVTCGSEGSVRRDAAVYCTSCATRRDWGTVLEAVQNPRGKNSPIMFDEPNDEADSSTVPIDERVEVPVTDEPILAPTAAVSSAQPSVATESPFAVLHGDAKPVDATRGESLVDESMLKAIDELTKSLEVLPTAEETRAQYASSQGDAAERDAAEPALALASQVIASAGESLPTPRYATPELGEQTEDPVAVPAAMASQNGHKADPFT
ncbi:hypothetical protein MNBD_ACTINO02-791 [hydrothermal vent metagenome]|uniref:Uncharacterized protein n=1 Tax=hydrothermal vent metagenome TaxID=652676 RepID=A0A3B0SHG3_9ZZZZ